MKFINWDMLKSPIDWAVIWMISIIGLFLIHVVMQNNNQTNNVFTNGPQPNGSTANIGVNS